MRSCAWIGNSSPWITRDSMFLTILSMSDCHGICFLIIDRGVSVGTNAWEVCVYSISVGKLCEQAVSQNQGVSLIIIVKLSALVLMGMIEMAKVNIFLSLDWIYSSVYSP